ncbi:MAG: cell division protein FtsA [Leptospiraceae bacterium]|nr:cell division protein FtsA [Leptospiraceae bacterium]
MKDYICSIDIGSSLNHVLVARPLADGSMEVIGVGTAPSRGVRNGSIVNIESTIQSIGEAVREAELMSGLTVDEALINITGRHLHGDNSRGVVAITNRERMVTERDVYRVIEGAQNIRIPGDQEIIHVLSREFTVDDQGGIKDPIGMTGVRLEAEVHIVTAGITALTNLNKAVQGAGIQVSGGVMSSLAAGEAVLGEDERELGVAVVDIGGGIADIIMYVEGGIYFSAVVPIGGIHVTQDLSIGLKVPVEVAEMVKKNYGAARIAIVDPTERIELPGISGRPARQVLRQQIAEVIEPRMREILELVDEQLVRSGKKKFLAGGVILTGGGALIEGTEELAEEVLGLTCAVRSPLGVEGFVDRVSSPEFATAVGILHYTNRMAEAPRVEAERRAHGGLVDKLKHWITENL